MRSQSVINRLRTLAVLALLTTFTALPQALAQPAPPADTDVLTALQDMEQQLQRPSVRAKLTSAQWQVYSHALVQNLKMDNDGVKQGSMRMIIMYGDYLDVKEAAFDVIRIYREHENDNVRRMAAVTIGKMKSGPAIGILERLAQFEDVPRVRQTAMDVVRAYREARQARRMAEHAS